MISKAYAIAENLKWIIEHSLTKEDAETLAFSVVQDLDLIRNFGPYYYKFGKGAKHVR